MPQVSIIIPVIVAGLAVGSAIRSKSPRISKKRLTSASLVAGILNGAYAYLQGLFFPSQTFPRGTNTAFTAFTRATSSLPLTSSEILVINSLLSGFLIVLAVLGIAMLYARRRKGEEVEDMSELPIEEESKPTTS
jgi:hypothetical protein